MTQLLKRKQLEAKNQDESILLRKLPRFDSGGFPDQRDDLVMNCGITGGFALLSTFVL
jgi:hypothetical protein